MAADKPLNQVLYSGFSHVPKQNFRSNYLLSVKMIYVAVVNVLSLEKELVSKMRLLFWDSVYPNICFSDASPAF